MEKTKQSEYDNIHGLSSEEASKLLIKEGYNELPSQKRRFSHVSGIIDYYASDHEFPR
ncbi:MAG: cation-transporting P-type ATPase [bacterium]